MIKNGKIWRGEIQNKAKDGSIYWVDSTVFPKIDNKSGEITGYISIKYDITKKKEADADEMRARAELVAAEEELEEREKIAEEEAAAAEANNKALCLLKEMMES